jgi:hypothetical protein
MRDAEAVLSEYVRATHPHQYLRDHVHELMADEIVRLRVRLSECEQTLALMAIALPDFKWAAWLLLHAAKQGVNEHRSMMDSQSIITQHIERIEDALDSTITAKKD